jgi:hypothetical protein
VGADSRRSHRIFGTPGSERLIVLVGTGVAVSSDPLPAATSSYDVCVLAVSLDGEAVEDSGVFGGETPVEQASAWLVDLINASLEPTPAAAEEEALPPVAIVAYRDAVNVALGAAVLLGDAVDRLALIAVAPPPEPLDRDDLAALITTLRVDTLIMNGQNDDPAGADAAAWYRDHLATAHVEMVADEGPLSLSAVWARTLAHLAPDSVRS